LNDFDEIAAIGEVSIVENEAWIVCVGILVKMINATGIETAGPALDAMHHIPLLQQ
jgi:hypothetical protein